MAKRIRSFNGCTACEGAQPGVVKLAATDVDGRVLDTAWLCRECALPAIIETPLILGDLSKLCDDRERLARDMRDRAARWPKRDREIG